MKMIPHTLIIMMYIALSIRNKKKSIKMSEANSEKKSTPRAFLLPEKISMISSWKLP